jgi:hypothetical protein
MNEVDWTGAMLTLTGDARNADVRFGIAEYIADNLSDFRPLMFPDFPFSLRGLEPERVKDDRVFSIYRAKVTELEGANASRLLTLGRTFLQLLDGREKSPAKADALVDRVGTYIEKVYRAPAPLDGETRNWSARHTRRYDLIPRVWREL